VPGGGAIGEAAHLPDAIIIRGRGRRAMVVGCDRALKKCARCLPWVGGIGIYQV